MIRREGRATKRDRRLGSGLRQSLRKPRERVTWLLGFAERAGSINTLSGGELQLLRSQVWDFSGRMMTSGSAQELSAANLARLSGEVWHGIRALIRGEPWRSRVRSMTLYLDVNGDRATRRYIAKHRDGFLIEAHELIAAEAKRLRQCLRKNCRRIFVANRRQVFCSLSCSQDERTERFLTSHGEEELSERRHARYVASIRRTKGPAVAIRIRRRPRRRKLIPLSQ